LAHALVFASALMISQPDGGHKRARLKVAGARDVTQRQEMVEQPAAVCQVQHCQQVAADALQLFTVASRLFSATEPDTSWD
jgi:hypothetical protein